MLEFHNVYTTNEAVDVLWKLLVERSEEDDKSINISHRKLPSREDHEKYIVSHIYYVWNLVSDEGRWVGYISITQKNEIGIVLFISERGKGYGKRIIQKLLDETQPLPEKKGERTGYFIANINPLNKRSIKLFEGLGFSHIQNTYKLDD